MASCLAEVPGMCLWLSMQPSPVIELIFIENVSGVDISKSEYGNIAIDNRHIFIIYDWSWSPVVDLVVGSCVSVCVDVCVSIWTHISVTADRNFLIVGTMMGYDVGMMPVVSNFWYCLVSQMYRQKCTFLKNVPMP